MSETQATISISSDLLKQTDQTAQELNLSRNEIITRALQQFIARHKKQQLAQAIHDAYKDDPQEEERELAEVYRRAAHRHLHLVEAEAIVSSPCQA